MVCECNVSGTIRWLIMKLNTDIHLPVRINCNNLQIPLLFYFFTFYFVQLFDLLPNILKTDDTPISHSLTVCMLIRKCWHANQLKLTFLQIANLR